MKTYKVFISFCINVLLLQQPAFASTNSTQTNTNTKEAEELSYVYSLGNSTFEYCIQKINKRTKAKDYLNLYNEAIDRSEWKARVLASTEDEGMRNTIYQSELKNNREKITLSFPKLGYYRNVLKEKNSECDHLINISEKIAKK